MGQNSIFLSLDHGRYCVPGTVGGWSSNSGLRHRWIYSLCSNCGMT